MKRKVYYTITPRTLGRRLRLMPFITIGLLLDRINASRTCWIVFFIIAGLHALLLLVERLRYKYEGVDIQQWLHDRYEGEHEMRERWAGARYEDKRRRQP